MPTKAHRRNRRKRKLSSARRILAWLTLDTISKVAAIGTPIVLGVGGWYLSDVWKSREENLLTYEKTSAAIGKASVVDAAGQRDLLLSVMQLGRADLLKRVASYIDARLTSEADAARQKIQSEKFASPQEQSLEIARTQGKYRTLRSEIFLPLLIGAINAGDDGKV
jgi:hypothetical protein